jgi:hypothetical protein
MAPDKLEPPNPPADVVSIDITKKTKFDPFIPERHTDMVLCLGKEVPLSTQRLEKELDTIGRLDPTLNYRILVSNEDKKAAVELLRNFKNISVVTTDEL